MRTGLSERFKAGSLTGYEDQEPEPRTTWYVLDRCHGYRIVARFDGPGNELRAKLFSHKLNQCDELLQRVLTGEIRLFAPSDEVTLNRDLMSEAEEVTRQG